MNVIDIVALIVVAIAFIDGFRKGAIKAVSNIAGIVFGIVVARTFSYMISPYLVDWFQITNAVVVQVISFVILFVLTIILFDLLAKLLDKLFKAIMLGWLNRLLGSILSIAIYLFVISIVLNIYEFFDKDKKWIGQERIEESFSYTPVKQFAPAIVPFLNIKEWKEKLPKKVEKSQQVQAQSRGEAFTIKQYEKVFG